MSGKSTENPGSIPGGTGVLPGWRALFHKHFVAPLVGSRNPPWFDARGVAVGLFVGFGCPVGGQVISLVLFRMIFRFNSVVAFAFSWVSNPFSVLPMYYAYYYLGSLILHRPSIMSRQAFREVMAPIVHTEYFWESVHSFSSLGWDIMLRWWVSAVLLAVVSGVIGYVATYHFQRLRCRRKAAKLGISYEKLVEDLEARLAKDKAP